jgi:voltage-gated potassium channel
MHRKRAVLGAGLRSLGTVTLLLVAYYQAPLDRPLKLSTGLLFVAALLLFAVVVVAQIRAILRSGRPRLLAIRALVLGVPLLLVLFAATYCTVGAQQPGAFSEPLSRTDGLYFATTTFATVGFGDITPRTELARILVTVQMLVGLLTVGVIAKVVLGAVREAEARRVEASAASPGELPARGNRVDDGEGGAGAPAAPGRRPRWGPRGGRSRLPPRAMAQCAVGSTSTNSALIRRVSGIASRAPSGPSGHAQKIRVRKVTVVARPTKPPTNPGWITDCTTKFTSALDSTGRSTGSGVSDGTVSAGVGAAAPVARVVMGRP